MTKINGIIISRLPAILNPLYANILSLSLRISCFLGFSSSYFTVILSPARYFVFQISSDNVARYNVVDSGSLMFFYNENENKWVMYYDFY